VSDFCALGIVPKLDALKRRSYGVLNRGGAIVKAWVKSFLRYFGLFGVRSEGANSTGVRLNLDLFFFLH
jgi:hypothetical protein